MCLEFMWLWFIHWCACDMLFTAIFIASTEVLQCLSISSVNHSRMKWDLLHFIPFMYSKCSPMKNGTHFFSHCILIFVLSIFSVLPYDQWLDCYFEWCRTVVAQFITFFSPFQIIFFLCFKDIIRAINLLMFSKRFFFRILQNIRFWWLQNWQLNSFKPMLFRFVSLFFGPFPNILVFNLTATLYYFLSQINFSLISVVKYCEPMGHLNSWIHDQLTNELTFLKWIWLEMNWHSWIHEMNWLTLKIYRRPTWCFNIFHPLLFVGKSEASKCKKNI